MQEWLKPFRLKQSVHIAQVLHRSQRRYITLFFLLHREHLCVTAMPVVHGRPVVPAVKTCSFLVSAIDAVEGCFLCSVQVDMSALDREMVA